MPTPPPYVLRTWIVAALVATSLAAQLGYDYFDRVERPQHAERMAVHRTIVDGTAPYQYRYRVLVPYAAEPLARALQHIPLFHGDAPAEGYAYGHWAFATAYLLLNLAALLLFLGMLFAVCRALFTTELALLGIALAAMVASFTFRDHFFHPWSFWEAALFAGGLWCVQTGRYGWFTFVVLLGAVNRETSVFLVLVFAFAAAPERGVAWSTWLRGAQARWVLASGVTWLAAWGAVHALVGYAPATFTLADARAGNLANLRYAARLNVLLFGPAWALVAVGLWRGPRLVRRAALVLPFYLGLLLVIGFWWEIRYWLTVLPILVPALLAGLVTVLGSPPPPNGEPGAGRE